jgi:hypothetical protein
LRHLHTITVSQFHDTLHYAVVLLGGGIILEVHERVFLLTLRGLTRTLGQFAGGQCAIGGLCDIVLMA